MSSDLIFGFILGLLGTLVFEGIKSILSPILIRKVGIFTLNPLLKLRMLNPWSQERAIANTIKSIFSSWASKDITTYESLWLDDCIKVVGSPESAPLHKKEITISFNQNTQKYKTLSVQHLLIESIETNKSEALVSVSYKFLLVRIADSLPVAEEAQEIYRLLKIDGHWKIAGNFDHFKTIQR